MLYMRRRQYSIGCRYDVVDDVVVLRGGALVCYP